jgi:hypothetical protein
MAKYCHLSKEIIDKSCKIKNGIVWAFLCMKQCPCTLEEIASHYNLSLRKTQIALAKMMEIEAVFAELIERKLHYKANPTTYFHSDGM